MDEKQLTALAEKAIAGDEGAFEKLYASHVRSILLHVRSLIYDKENCYDVAQDAVLEMFTNIHRLRNPAAFRGWMHQVVRATCYAHNRSLVRARKHEDADSDEEVFESIEDEDSNIDPEARTMAKLEGNRLFAVISELPENYREIIFQRYYDDMTYKEIAEVQAISVSNVSTRLARATEALRKKLGEKGEEYGTRDKGTAMNKDNAHTQASAGGSSDHLGQPSTQAEQPISHPEQPPYHPEQPPCHPERSEGSLPQENDDLVGSTSSDPELDGVRTPNDISIGNEGSVKSAVVGGAAMLFPNESVAQFLGATNTKLVALGSTAAAAGGVTAAASLKFGTKVLIGIVSVLLVVSVTVTTIVVTTTSGGEERAPLQQAEEPVYRGTMHLEFVDAQGKNTDENVVSITLVEDEATAVSTSWQLYWIADDATTDESGVAAPRADSRELSSGNGYEVDSSVLTSLEPGYYLVVFTLTDAQDAATQISRNFTIE